MSDEHDEPRKRKPLVSYSVGPLSVALWENDIEGTDRKSKSVTIRKTFSSNGQLDSRSVSINTAEVGCLVGLLHRMEDAVIQEQTPF